MVLLSGDAGIGKSRLVQMLKDHVANQSHTRWECRSSSYFENTALFPVTDLFQRLLQFQAEETPDEKLGKLEQMLSQYRRPLEDSVPLFAPLLSLPLPENRYPLLNLSPQRQRQKTLETMVAILQELAEHQPVLFIVEDLHWTDPTTLELLNLLIDQTPTASMLGVADLSSAFPTFLASPFVYYRNDVEPLIPCPGGTDCHRHDRWKNLTTRGTPADRREDGWRPIVCRGNDQSYSGIRTAHSRRWALRTRRVFVHVHDSGDLAGFSHGTA